MILTPDNLKVIWHGDPARGYRYNINLEVGKHAITSSMFIDRDVCEKMRTRLLNMKLNGNNVRITNISYKQNLDGYTVGIYYKDEAILTCSFFLSFYDKNNQNEFQLGNAQALKMELLD